MLAQAGLEDNARTSYRKSLIHPLAINLKWRLLFCPECISDREMSVLCSVIWVRVKSTENSMGNEEKKYPANEMSR